MSAWPSADPGCWMGALESAQRELHDALADPAFYRRDGGEIAEARARLEALEQELTLAYERWETLEGLAG
jgi:ABC transport system ATP-binding/permease protein